MSGAVATSRLRGATGASTGATTGAFVAATGGDRGFASDAHTEELLVTQRAFRAVMDAMARPGLVRFVPPMFQATLTNPWMEALVQMLVDSTCGFCVAAADAPALATAIATRSYAAPVAFDRALFAIVSIDADAELRARMLRELSGGADDAPELGATVIIECAALSEAGDGDGDDAHVFSVTGPGVERQHRFAASENWWHVARESRSDEFPCGIDVLLVDGAGRVVALPRTARVTEQTKDIAFLSPSSETERD